MLTLMIDNDYAALTGEISTLCRKSGSGCIVTNVCDIVDWSLLTAGESSTIKVDYSIHHSHGNLHSFRLTAKYGQDESVDILPQITYSRSGSYPFWDGTDSSVEHSRIWQSCAYEFRLEARRRLTDGETRRIWEEFTYHVTINNPENPYTPSS